MTVSSSVHETVQPPPPSQQKIQIDVIIPVHNAADTLRNTISSVWNQQIRMSLQQSSLIEFSWHVAICCFDDASTDSSWSILQELLQEFQDNKNSNKLQDERITMVMKVKKSSFAVGRGAGYARNRAVEVSGQDDNSHMDDFHFLCLLDSDDRMHPHRIAEQVTELLQLPVNERHKTLLGSRLDRDPPGSTWHYTQWANTLPQDRLYLERFRECTLLQPTWCLTRKRFIELGGYVEAPPMGSDDGVLKEVLAQEREGLQRLVHPVYDSIETLRLAEDLRFFQDHLDRGGLLRRCAVSETPLVSYQHSPVTTSQSVRTSRKLLLQLRLLALERSVLQQQWYGRHFAIWGAGRDGKDFLKHLKPELRSRVYCYVDVDAKKLSAGHYVHREWNLRIPIIHYSFLMPNANDRQNAHTDWETSGSATGAYARITKSKPTQESGDRLQHDEYEMSPSKRRKASSTQPLQLHGLDLELLAKIPVVICVAMYRTHGALEQNVASIGRQEGIDLWHFS